MDLPAESVDWWKVLTERTDEHIISSALSGFSLRLLFMHFQWRVQADINIFPKLSLAKGGNIVVRLQQNNDSRSKLLSMPWILGKTLQPTRTDDLIIYVCQSVCQSVSY